MLRVSKATEAERQQAKKEVRKLAKENLLT